MRHLWLALIVWTACSKGPSAPATLSPRFETAAKRAAGGDPHAFDDVLGTFEPSSDPAETASAVARVMAAYKARVSPSVEGCDTKVMRWYELGRKLVETAPSGDSRQLEAALWFGHQLAEHAPTMLGTMMQLDIQKLAVERLREAKVPATPAMREWAPPADLALRTFARESLCVMRAFDEKLKRGEPRLAGLADQIPEFVAFAEQAMDSLEAAGADRVRMIAALNGAYAAAAASDSELVRITVVGGVWDDLDRDQKPIEDYLR